jgi:O-antigen/teichoic acid export membrane protein
MNLRSQVLHGGIYLVSRQVVGIAIGVVGMILLTRAIGPEAYGLYAAALGIYLYFVAVCQWGVDIYLIRHEGEPQPEDYHQAFSLLLLLGLVGAGLAVLAVPYLGRWMRLEGFGPVAVTLFASLPVNLLQLVPLARLERALDYRRVALIELSGQTATYVVALPLAYQGLGAWAPVGGMWASRFLALGLLYGMSGYRPRLHWEFARIRTMAGYGLGISASDWLWQLRNLVNPLVVGRYAGAEAVGQVALAIRLVEQLSFIVDATAYRLSIPVFALLQENRARLVKAVSEGTNLQLMAVGPLFAGFGLVAPWVVPLVFGPRWLPVLEVYPFIAVTYLCGAAFSLQASALYVVRGTWGVAFFHLVHLVLFAGSAVLLVPHLGFRGYGWAEVVALPSYTLILIWFQVYVGRMRYAQALVWFTAWAVPLFSWQLNAWAWTSLIVPLIVSLIWPAPWRELLRAVALVLRRTNEP